MIKFVNVSKDYEDSDTHALRKTSLTINDGEFVFIVGSSGAGKSTLLKLIMREQLPTSGDIIIDDQVINKLSRKEVPYLRRKMGMVYQDFRLIDKMNVFDNVAFAMRVIGASPSEIRKRVPFILKLVGLEHKIKVRPSQLSGGERQRVSLARAIVNKPKVVIADEPTANVDFDMSIGIIKLLKKINEDGTTVIVVTHDKDIVKEVGGRIIELDQGRVISDTGASQPEHSHNQNSDNADDSENSSELLNDAKDDNVDKTEDNAEQKSENTYAVTQEKEELLDMDRYDRLISENTAEQTDKK